MSSLITCQAHMIMHFCYIANSYIYGGDILNGSVLHNLPGIRRQNFRNFHDFLSISIQDSHFRNHLKYFYSYVLLKKRLTFLTDYKYSENFLLLKGQFLSKISYQKVVLNQQCLFYIFGLSVKLQPTYPDLFPRYTIRIHQ